MHDAVSGMLAKYRPQSLDDHAKALREIIQEIALLGLWRSRFFERAAFYGGTALRILHGLDRFSEDLDFTLLRPVKGFALAAYGVSLKKELAAFGFDVHWEQKDKKFEGPVQSAFLKADTFSQMLVISAGDDILKTIPRGQALKIKLEVDTDPPGGFSTETRYLLAPIPFAVRVVSLPDLFAGKMHSVLCRKWKGRVKGRDWYDLVWYVSHHPGLHLDHLEQRMRQSRDWEEERRLTEDDFKRILHETIDRLDVEQARREVSPFVRDKEALGIWSREFFHDIAARIRCE